MARLIPSIDIEDIRNVPERDVARQLVDLLPNDCVVFHSYPWLRPERNDRGVDHLAEGETDFVILDPNRGLLTLEVKGGAIEYFPDQRGWCRRVPSGIKEIGDPFEQVRKNHHRLLETITGERDGAGGKLGCSHGYAVVFPDCDYEGAVPPGANAKIILRSRDLPFLDRRIPEILDSFARRDKAQGPSPDVLKKIKDGLLPAFRLLPVLSRQIRADEEVLVRATATQQDALSGVYENDRVLVNGPAGTGKTMLAMARAREFSRHGKSTLFLCFNKTLAEWLRSVITDDRITVRHFHALAAELCRDAGIPFKPPFGDDDSATFWKRDAAELLDKAASIVATRFDAIVVDEAQDFHEDWWMPIELLSRKVESGPLYIFCDPHQNLYGAKPSYPDVQVRYTLKKNCRNTQRITEMCGSILGTALECHDDAPDGIEPEIVTIQTESDRRQFIDRKVREWTNKGQLRPSQIAVLSPYSRKNSSLASATTVGGIALCDELDAWYSGSGVLFSTVKSFKGLEADAVIVTDVKSISPAFTKSDLYVACSRGKHLLVVLAAADGALSVAS